MAPERLKNPPLTEAQIAFFTEHAEAAAEKASWKTAKHVQRRALVGFIILVIGMLVVFNLGQRGNNDSRDAIVSSGQVVSVVGCNRDYEDRVQFIEVLLRGKAAVIASHKSGITTDAQFQQGIEFYDQQLDEYKLIDCRTAEDILTSDPTKPVEKPRPFYPGEITAPEVQVPKGVRYTPVTSEPKDG